MARIDWLIAGKSFGNCDCDDGCPCQFENPPTDGGCSAITTNGAIAFTLKVSDAQFNRLRHNGGGVIQ